MPHRILHIIPTLDRGGAEKQLSLLAPRLPRDEFDVQVCALTRGGPWKSVLEQAGIPVTVIGKSWKLDPSTLYRLYRHVRACRPTLVHSWIFAANSYGRAAAKWAGVPHLVASERCVDPWKSGLQLRIDRWLAKKSDAIVVNSEGTRAFYTRHGIPTEKFVLIPNGIDVHLPDGFPPDVTDNTPNVNHTDINHTDFNHADSNPTTSIREQLGFSRSAELVVAVGRLWPQKRVKDLIWAMDLLKGVRPDTHLVIVGDGPQRYRLEHYRNSVQIQDRVHFLGPQMHVTPILRQANCFWLGSGYEGQSNALMEAMALGLPVVVSDIVGNRELVQDDSSGYLVRVGDPTGFARKTQLILNDRSLAERLGRAARQVMEERYRVEAMVERHVELYRRIVAS